MGREKTQGRMCFPMSSQCQISDECGNIALASTFPHSVPCFPSSGTLMTSFRLCYSGSTSPASPPSLFPSSQPWKSRTISSSIWKKAQSSSKSSEAVHMCQLMTSAFQEPRKPWSKVTGHDCV